LLRLKAERILDFPANRQRPAAGDAERMWLDERDRQSDQGPHAFIGGRPIAPELLDELVSAAARLFQPTGGGAPPSSVDADADPGIGQEQPKAVQPTRRGRKKADYATVQREAALAAEWERVRGTGGYKPTFAKDKELTVADLDKLLDRVAKRKRNSE
jgi:hypothetical protein